MGREGEETLFPGTNFTAVIILLTAIEQIILLAE